MRKVLLWVITAFLACNGLAMLVAPEAWYQWVRTVPHTGPLNVHFVRDIGCAYLASAAGLAFFALRPDRGRPAAAVGLSFLAMHALVHIWDTLAGRASVEHLVSDFVGVFAIPMLAGWFVFGCAAGDSH